MSGIGGRVTSPGGAYGTAELGAILRVVADAAGEG